MPSILRLFCKDCKTEVLRYCDTREDFSKEVVLVDVREYCRSKGHSPRKISSFSSGYSCGDKHNLSLLQAIRISDSENGKTASAHNAGWESESSSKINHASNQGALSFAHNANDQPADRLQPPLAAPEGECIICGHRPELKEHKHVSGMSDQTYRALGLSRNVMPEQFKHAVYCEVDKTHLKNALKTMRGPKASSKEAVTSRSIWKHIPKKRRHKCRSDEQVDSVTAAPEAAPVDHATPSEQHRHKKRKSVTFGDSQQTSRTASPSAENKRSGERNGAGEPHSKALRVPVKDGEDKLDGTEYINHSPATRKHANTNTRRMLLAQVMANPAGFLNAIGMRPDWPEEEEEDEQLQFPYPWGIDDLDHAASTINGSYSAVGPFRPAPQQLT